MAEQREQSEQAEQKRVVAIAIDESEHSEHAFQWYIDNVMRKNDYVVLIHTPELYDLSMASPAVVDQLLRVLTDKVAALEEKYKEKIQAQRMAGKFRTGQGKPGEVICKLAEEEHACLVIAGCRGLGKIRRTFLGSVSDYIIHHSTVPVLVCRHPHH